MRGERWEVRDMFCGGRNYGRDCIGGREEVAGIEETDVVAIKGTDTFVHRVIDAVVWF